MLEAATIFAVSLAHILSEMSPYLLFGFLVAGLLSVVFSDAFVRRHLGGTGAASVAKASLFGVPLPLCSCGVIPVGVSLKKQGAGPGAVVSFLISTPQTGVDSILITLSLLGPLMAVVRPVAAFVTGLAGGVAANLLVREEAHGQACPLDPTPGDGAAPGHWLARALRYGLVALPRDIGWHLVLGLAAAAFITVLVPDDFFAGRLGTGVTGMLVMMLFGIPIYVCASASVPIAAALVGKGVSLGAVLVFLMTGPATNVATLAAIWKVLGRRSALAYLGTIAVGAIGFGFALDAVAAAGVAPEVSAEHVHGLLPAWVKYASAAGLVAVLANALLPGLLRRGGGEAGPPEGREKLVFAVEGMTCGHCASKVEAAALSVEGVEKASVDLASGSLVVMGASPAAERVERAVSDAGYAARLSTRSPGS